MMVTSNGQRRDGRHLPQWVLQHWPALQQQQTVLRREVCWPDGRCELADLFVGDEFVRAGQTLLDVVLRAPGGIAVLVFDKTRRTLIEYESQHAPEAIVVCEGSGAGSRQATLPAACADDHAH